MRNAKQLLEKKVFENPNPKPQKEKNYLCCVDEFLSALLFLRWTERPGVNRKRRAQQTMVIVYKNNLLRDRRVRLLEQNERVRDVQTTLKWRCHSSLGNGRRQKCVTGFSKWKKQPTCCAPIVARFFPHKISASNDPLVLAMNAEHRPSKTFDAIGFVRNRRLDATVPMVNTVSKKQFEPGSRVTQ